MSEVGGDKGLEKRVSGDGVVCVWGIGEGVRVGMAVYVCVVSHNNDSNVGGDPRSDQETTTAPHWRAA